MFIKKSRIKLFKELDENLVIPKGFDRFVDKITKKHNLNIKIGPGKYRCTYCNREFESINKKSDQKIKCPNCKQSLIIKSSKLKHFDFYDCVGVIDRYSDYWIIRYFEISSSYNGSKFKTDTCEYGRKIFNEDFQESDEIINNHVYINMWTCTVKHDGKFLNNKWRYFSSYYHGLGDALIFFPGNMKKIFQYSAYEYSHMWILAKHKDYFDLASLLSSYNNSYEFLIKLKLYNLVGNGLINNYGKTFNERFGVDKKFLRFMQRYHITYNELQVLKYYQKENIKTIRHFANLDIDQIVKFNLDLDILKNELKINSGNIHEYSDYLRIAALLEYDMKDKRILYPKDITLAHNQVVSLYEINESKIIQKAIKKRYKELVKNSYENKKYIIFPASSVSSLVDESKQQNNCVKTYAERIAEGKCEIYFMRLISNKDKSLVTVEVKNKHVVQKRTKNNQQTTEEQDKFLDLWERKILKGGL